MKRILSASALALLFSLLCFEISSGETVWTGKRLTVSTGASLAPAVAVDSADNVYVAYKDDLPGNMEIYVRISADSGTTWSWKRLTNTSGASSSPAIAVDSADNVFVVYHDNTSGSNKIYLKKSTDKGSTWTDNQITTGAGASEEPAIAIDSADNIYVFYQEMISGNFEIFYKKSTDGGSVWTGKKIAATAGASVKPAAALDSADNVYVVYQDDTPGNSEIYMRKSVDGGITWTGKRLTATGGISSAPAIAVDSVDNIYVTYQDDTPGNSEIYIKKSTDGGSTWTGKRLTTTAGISAAPDLIVDGADNVHVVYQDNQPGNHEIFIETSIDGGSTWTSKKHTASAGMSSAPSIAFGSADVLYLVYQDNTPGNSEIYLRKGVPQPKIAFVTSVSGQGNLGAWADAGGKTGLAAGDAICQARADAVWLTGTFVAWLSDDNDDAYCRIHGLTGKKASNCGKTSLPIAAGPWLRTDGLPFAGRIDKLTSLDMVYHPLRYDENGTDSGDGSPLTGTLSTGVRDEAAPCSNWTSSADTLWVTAGSTSRTAANWSAGGNNRCDYAAHMFCLQSGKGPSLPKFGTSGKRAFLTSVMGNGKLGSWPNAGGKTGIQAGDAICNNLALAAGLSGTFRAWLSTGAIDAKARFSGGPWVRLDGAKVANSVADLTDGNLFTPINLTEKGEYRSNWAVWTGTDFLGGKSVDRCSNWTSEAGTVKGQIGIANESSRTWTHDWGPMGCDFLYSHLYCLEN